MPSKRQLAQMDPTSNALVGKKPKKGIQVKDLFGGAQEDSELELNGEDSFNMAEERFFEGTGGS